MNKKTNTNICIEKNCNVNACFNFLNEQKRLYCSKHKKEGMINIVSKKCLEEHCNKQPNFNLQGIKEGIYCSEHKKDSMIDVKNKKCIELECNSITPCFNYKNEKKGIYCDKHKKEDMVNIKSKKCIEEKCNKQPHFNLINEKKAIYCLEHKKNNMVDVISKKCIEKNCNKQPIFNLPNNKKGIYCCEHKKENMIDVISKRCLEENCNKRQTFNYKGNKPLYCSEHKKENMIDVKHNNKCIDQNCDSLNPCFNFLHEKIGIYCSTHKKEGMIDIVNKKCIEINCNKVPTYNFENHNIRLYCVKHKKDGMIDIRSKRCLEENCNIVPSNKKYKGYCLRCFINLFPNEKISRHYKVKENHMTDFIKANFNEEIMIFDKQTGGCSKRRPDCYIDKFTHIIIIECDENQHRDTSCENKRTMELFQDFCNRPIVFIRFNPDKYINEKGEKNPSSFKYHKTLDVPVIKSKKEWNNRLNVLKECMNKHLKIIPEKEVTNEFLFYDYKLNESFIGN
jgi:hypothetical protein